MKSCDIEIVYLDTELLDIVVFVFWTHERIEFQKVVRKHKLAFNPAKVCAVVN